MNRRITNVEGRATVYPYSEAPASYVFSGCNSLSGEHRAGIYIKRGVMKNEKSAVNVKRRGHSLLILSLRAESGGAFPTDGVEKSQNYRQRSILGDVSTAFPKNTGTSLDMTGIHVDTRGASLSSSIPRPLLRRLSCHGVGKAPKESGHWRKGGPSERVKHEFPPLKGVQRDDFCDTEHPSDQIKNTLI